jgi:hypothetical protein
MSQEDPSTLVKAVASSHVDLTVTSYVSPPVFGGVTVNSLDYVFLPQQNTDPADGIYQVTFDTPATPSNVAWRKVCDGDPLALLTVNLRILGAGNSIDVFFDKYQESFAKVNKTLVLSAISYDYKYKLQIRESVTEITTCRAQLWAPNWGDLRTLRAFFITNSRAFTNGNFSIPESIEAQPRKAITYGCEIGITFELSYQLPVWGPQEETVTLTDDAIIDFTDTPGDFILGNPNP